MPLSISNDSKNTLSISNEDKTGAETTWDEADFTWDEAGGATWDNPGLPITKDTKNTLSISNESKN